MRQLSEQEYNELKTLETRIDDQYGVEAKARFTDFVNTVFTEDQKLTFDEVLYVAEIFTRGSN